MTIKIEIVAADQQELTTKLLALANALRMGGNVQTGVEQATAKSSDKVEEAAPEPEEKAPAKGKKGAAAKPTPKKSSGPSEDTLREYVGTLAAYLLNDPEEAPQLEELLGKWKSEDLEGIEADDLADFTKELFALVDGIFDGVPAVPTK